MTTCEEPEDRLSEISGNFQGVSFQQKLYNRQGEKNTVWYHAYVGSSKCIQKYMQVNSDTEKRLLVDRGRGCGAEGGHVGKGGQKLHPSSYKIDMTWHIIYRMNSNS